MLQRRLASQEQRAEQAEALAETRAAAEAAAQSRAAEAEAAASSSQHEQERTALALVEARGEAEAQGRRAATLRQETLAARQRSMETAQLESTRQDLVQAHGLLQDREAAVRGLSAEAQAGLNRAACLAAESAATVRAVRAKAAEIGWRRVSASWLAAVLRGWRRVARHSAMALHIAGGVVTGVVREMESEALAGSAQAALEATAAQEQTRAEQEQQAAFARRLQEAEAAAAARAVARCGEEREAAERELRAAHEQQMERMLLTMRTLQAECSATEARAARAALYNSPG